MDERHPTREESERFASRRLVQPFVRFTRAEAASGIVLLAAAAAGVAWANSPFSDAYHRILATPVSLELGPLHLDETVLGLINDGLMAIFFFVVGLEIKRELVTGELSDRRAATLPIMAALGGMLAPALFYLALNGTAGEAARGWGIPMATDIAFAVGVVALLGHRVPVGAKVFLLALAIVDDIGAIAVIALFYTEELHPGYLVWAIAGLAAIWGAQRMGIRSYLFYIPMALAIWFLTLESGVHATLAGVALGLLAPVSAPNRLELRLVLWTSFLVVPLFALANSGIDFGSTSIDEAMGSPVTMGILAGLVLGKALGISLFSWIAVKSGMGRLPEGTRWAHIAGVATVAGIGFTVSLFITGLAFTDPDLIGFAKIGIFAGSLLAGVGGAFVLTRIRSQPT